MSQNLKTKNQADNSKIRENTIQEGLSSLVSFARCVVRDEGSGGVAWLAEVNLSDAFVENRGEVLPFSQPKPQEADCPIVDFIREMNHEYFKDLSVYKNEAKLTDSGLFLEQSIEALDDSEDFLYDLLAIKLSQAGIEETELLSWSRFVKLASDAEQTIQDLSRDAIKRILRSWSSVCGLIINKREARPLGMAPLLG